MIKKKIMFTMNYYFQILFYIYDKMLEWNKLNKEKHDYIEDLRNKILEKKN